jgi:hypothetical protein
MAGAGGSEVTSGMVGFDGNWRERFREVENEK